MPVGNSAVMTAEIILNYRTLISTFQRRNKLRLYPDACQETFT